MAEPAVFHVQAFEHGVHHRCYAEGAARAVLSRSWPLVCNGFLLADETELARPPSTVSPVASQVAERFRTAGRGDANPVTWWTLAHRGIAVRGPEPSELAVHLDDAELRRWTAGNLVSYWRPWAEAITGDGPAAWAAWFRTLSARRLVASGVLGTARMHATIATGEVITKEQAGEYASATFEPRWHAIIEDALAYWRSLPPRLERPIRALRAETVSFVRHVIDLVGS